METRYGSMFAKTAVHQEFPGPVHKTTRFMSNVCSVWGTETQSERKGRKHDYTGASATQVFSNLTREGVEVSTYPRQLSQPNGNGLQSTRNGLQPNSNGLQTTSNGLQPNSNGLQPSDGLQPNNSHGLQPNSNGMQPTIDGLQPNSHSIEFSITVELLTTINDDVFISEVFIHYFHNVKPHE